MDNSAKDVADGKSIRAAAKAHGIDRMTLKRYIKTSSGSGNASYGYRNFADKQRIFSIEFEADLASHVKNLAKMFHGLINTKLQKLAYEFASANNVKVPSSWWKMKKQINLILFIFRHMS